MCRIGAKVVARSLFPRELATMVLEDLTVARALPLDLLRRATDMIVRLLAYMLSHAFGYDFSVILNVFEYTHIVRSISWMFVSVIGPLLSLKGKGSNSSYCQLALSEICEKNQYT